MQATYTIHGFLNACQLTNAFLDERVVEVHFILLCLPNLKVVLAFKIVIGYYKSDFADIQVKMICCRDEFYNCNLDAGWSAADLVSAYSSTSAAFDLQRVVIAKYPRCWQSKIHSQLHIKFIDGVVME